MIINLAYWVIFSTAIMQAAIALLQLNAPGEDHRGYKSATQAAMFFLAAIAIGVYA